MEKDLNGVISLLFAILSVILALFFGWERIKEFIKKFYSKRIYNDLDKFIELDSDFTNHDIDKLRDEKENPFKKNKGEEERKNIENKQKYVRKLNYVTKLDINPILEIIFDIDLESCAIIIPNTNVLPISKPLLLKECCCQIDKEYLNNKFSCRIHQNRELGDKIINLFKKKYVQITYHGINILWFDGGRVLWPPAIDSIFMAKVLEDNGYTNNSSIRRIMDIGCGTGFLGIFLSKLNSEIEKVYFSDILLTPLFFTKLNFELNFSDNKKRIKELKFFISETYTHIPNEEIYKNNDMKIDLVVSNPPYLPSLDIKDKLDLTDVTGTHLLERLVEETGTYARELVIGCSEMALP